MKISFSENLENEDGSGKHKFLFRLKKEFSKMGIKFDADKPDIHLFIPGSRQHKKAKFNILRLDGMTINKNDTYMAKNDKIKHLIDKSDAIIYQNEFCKKAYEKFLRVSGKKNACILNGADPADFLERKPSNFFLANCRWRPHKRLETIIESFLEAELSGLDADLVVTGDPGDITHHHDRIKYVGWVKPDELKVLLSEAIAAFHLSWIDWCPNAMVESISARCPIIYSNSGGHPYVAGDCGIPIEDVQWDFKPCNYYSPPQLSVESIVNAMMNIPSGIKVARPELEISAVAKQYIKFFGDILKGKQ